MSSNEKKRFQDQNFRLSHFEQEVHVQCPSCAKKALAKVDHIQKEARLICPSCGFHKQKSTFSKLFGISGHWERSADKYFSAQLWYQITFKNDIFWAYNLEHLNYLEHYIGAALREHQERSHYTLLEKLPKFYHEAKNRDALLKLIQKLKNK